ncbi:MAG: FliA/WhiG family RNA polymerase sigma factor [Peptococcaceae bacterium]
MEAKRELWQNYYLNPTLENRDKLITKYAPLINYCAQRIYQGLPNTVDFDDLISYGSFGLMDAINRFDLKLNNSFERYAILRIRGAIIDGLRKMDWAPQSIRRKAKEIEKAFTILEQQLGRIPTEMEAALFLGITEEELAKQLQDIGYLSIVSLEQPIDNENSNILTLSDLIIDQKSPDPLQEIELTEMKNSLASAIKDLNEKEKLVITLFYYEELTVKEISKILELSEGRISQIHKKAILKLKGRLSKLYV